MTNLFNRHHSIARTLLVVLLIILSVLLLASCSSVRKSQTTYKATSDSTHLMAKDSSHLVTVDSGRLQLKIQDSTGVSTTESNSTTEILITLETTPAVADYPSKPSDYYTDTIENPRRRTLSFRVKGPGSVDIDLGGRKALSVQVKQSDWQHSTGSSRVVQTNTDSSFYHKKDSVDYHVTDSASSHSDVNSSASSKFKRRVSIVVYLAAGLLFLFMLFFIFRKLRDRFRGSG